MPQHIAISDVWDSSVDTVTKRESPGIVTWRLGSLRVLIILPAFLAAGLLASQAFAATAVISNERSGNLIFMDEAGDTTDVIPLCKRPRGMARGASGNLLYIACSDDNEIVEFDTQTKRRLRAFGDVDGAMSLALHQESGRLIVSNEGKAKATVLDISSGNVLATLPTGREPDGVALAHNGSLIFIASENAGIVHVFDGNSYEEVTRIITNLRPRRLAVREGELWVSSEMGSRVEIFDIATFKKIDEVMFAPRGFRSEQLTPVDIIFDQSESMAFVALGSANHVVFVDAESRKVLKYILVGRRPWGLAITPDGKRLFVLNGLSDDVTIIDIAKKRPVRTSRTGLVPHAVEIMQ